MELFLLMAAWAAAVLAIAGSVRLLRPRLPHTLFDRTHRGMGWLAVASLAPALLGALIHLVTYPGDVLSLLGVFPMLWFVTLGGGSAFALAELSGVRPNSAEGEAVWAYATGGITLALVVIAALAFHSVRPGQRHVPDAAKLVGLVVLLNSFVGLVMMTPMLLDD